jgi:polyphosphate kinase
VNKVIDYKYIDREKSWLAFNARVLQTADNSVPLLERLRFFRYFSNNLDEIFLELGLPLLED